MSDFVFSIDTGEIEDVQNGISDIKQAVDQTPAYLETTMGGFGITQEYATKIYLINEISAKAEEISAKLAELLEWITAATQSALDLDDKNAKDVNGGNGGSSGGGSSGGGTGGGGTGISTPTADEPEAPEQPTPTPPDQPSPETPEQPTPTPPDQPIPTPPDQPSPETPEEPTPVTPSEPPQAMYGPAHPETPEQPTPEQPEGPGEPTPEQPAGPGSEPSSPGASGAGVGGMGGAQAQPTAPTGPDELSSALKEGLNNNSGMDSNYKMGSAKLTSTTKPTAAGKTKGINPWAVAGLGLAAGGLALGAGLIIKNNAYYTFSPEDWQILSTPIKNAIINDFKKAGLTDEDIDKFINSTFKIKVTEFDKYLNDIKKVNEVDVGLEIEVNDMYGFSCFDSDEKLVKYAVFIMLIIDGVNLSDEFNLYNILNVSLDEEDVKMDYNGLNMFDYLEEGDLSSSETEEIVEESVEGATQDTPTPTDMNIPQPYEGY